MGSSPPEAPSEAGCTCDSAGASRRTRRRAESLGRLRLAGPLLGMTLLLRACACAEPEAGRRLVQLTCPATEPSELPNGFKEYPGNSEVFHCGFIGLIQDTEVVPAEFDEGELIAECFYDDEVSGLSSRAHSTFVQARATVGSHGGGMAVALVLVLLVCVLTSALFVINLNELGPNLRSWASTTLPQIRKPTRRRLVMPSPIVRLWKGEAASSDRGLAPLREGTDSAGEVSGGRAPSKAALPIADRSDVASLPKGSARLGALATQRAGGSARADGRGGLPNQSGQRLAQGGGKSKKGAKSGDKEAMLPEFGGLSSTAL